MSQYQSQVATDTEAVRSIRSCTLKIEETSSPNEIIQETAMEIKVQYKFYC